MRKQRSTAFLPEFLRAVGLLVVLTAMALTAPSQTSGTGTITGTVTDSKNALVSGANVLIHDVDTGIDRTVPTNSDGLFVSPFLHPGNYELTVSGPGFSTVTQKNLTLTVGQTLTLQFVLPLGSVSASVEVSSQSLLLDTEKTEVSQTVDQKLISNLPVNGRNWSNFALLTNNVVNDGTSGLVSYHGVSGLYNSNYVDGSNNNELLFSEARGRASGAPYVYSLDAIQEFQVDNAVYSAEFGQAAGGQVNAITKSGTNAVHGDLFYYLRYPSLNALDPYTKFQGRKSGASPLLLTPPIHQQQQFGGSVGGPIIKDKLFYFFTYDGFRKVQPVTYTSTANISTTPSGSTTNTSVITPTQCPTTITAAQCTSAISYLQSLSGAYSRVGHNDIFFPRIDWQIGAKNHMFVDFNFGNYKLPSGYSASPSYTNTSITVNGNAYYHERFLVGGLTTEISSRSLNEIHAQWGRDLETAGVNAPGPNVSIGNVQQYGEPNALPRTAEPDEHRYQFTDIFSQTRGHHTFKVGGDINIIHEVMINLFQGGGLYSYSGGAPASNFARWAQDVFGGGTHYSSFVQVNDPITHVGKDDFWMKLYDGFFEDTWKIAPKVTLNLGARYDLQITPQPTHPNTTVPGLSDYYTGTLKTVKTRIVPRFGFAWTPYQGTVVRGGYGVFSALTQGSTYYAMRVENGVYQTNYSFNSPTAPGAPQFPNVLFTPPGPAVAAPFSGAAVPQVLYPSGVPSGSPLITSFHGLDPHFVPPLAHEYQLGVEQEMPGRLTLSVGFVGARALRLPVFIDGNLARSTTTRNYNIVDGSGNITRNLTVPYYTARISNAIGSINTGFSVINSWYNSLAFSIKRPFDHGVQLLLNYTFAKATDTGQVGGAFGTFYGGDSPSDPYNIKGEYGRSDLDVRGRFIGSIVYQPLFTRNISNKVARYAVNGFVFSGIITAQDGLPLTPYLNGYPQTTIGAASGAVEGGLTGGVMSSSSGGATAGRAPQVQRNSFRGPGIHNIDFRITRDFAIHEQVKFQVLAEAFNVLNHANVFGVSTTAFQFVAPGKALPSGGTCATSGATGFNGCVAPYIATPFATPTSTSGGNLYGARQLQVAAKLYF